MLLVAVFWRSLMSGWRIFLLAGVVAGSSLYLGVTRTNPVIPFVVHPLLVLGVQVPLGNLGGGIGVDNPSVFGINPAIASPYAAAGVLLTVPPYLLGYGAAAVVPRFTSASTRA